MSNWVEEYERENKGLPPLPIYLKEVCIPPDKGGKVSKDMTMVTPSGQLFNNWTNNQREKWRGVVEWCGKDPDDYEAHMRRMLPKNSPRMRGAR